MTRLINIDNGGTLTDVCVVDGDEVRYTKTLTTPFDLSRCLFDGLTKASALIYGRPQVGALLQATDHVRYSTTQGTNALVQRRGPRLGLLSTDPTLVEALAATSAEEDLLTALVGERHATVDVSAADAGLAADLVARFNALTAAGASRVVVSIGGPDGAAQEKRVKRLLLRLYPRHLLGAIPLLFSWELAADRDDVRRTWSGLLNAFLHPAMERFLFNTEQRLRDHRTRRPLLIFRNDGGSSRVAESAAIKTYSSGPRGGLEGTRALSRTYGFRHVLMADVGGTTTDIGVVTDGAVEVNARGRVERVPTSFELAAITVAGDGGELERGGHPLHPAARVHLHRAVGDHADVGGGAADVGHQDVPEAVGPGQRAGALQAAARTGAVGLDRRGLGDPGGAAVVAEDQQRAAGAVVPQPLLGVEQKPLHRRVQERVEQPGPGPPHVVPVGGQLPGEQQRDRAEQVPRVQPQQQALDPLLLGRPVRAADRHHDPAGTGGGQRVEPGDQVGREPGVGRGDVDRGVPLPDQGRQQVLLGGRRGQRLDQGRIGAEQPQPRPPALHQRVGALGGGVPDVVGGLQQRTDLRPAVDQRGCLGQPVEQAAAEVERRGQRLGVPDLVAVDHADVGERPTVVDVDEPRHAAL